MPHESRTSRVARRLSQSLVPLGDDVAKLFPLPLTPFENYMYLDGLAGNSMVFAIRLEVEGVLDRDALTAAVAFAARRHPLSRAVVTRGRWGRRVWRLSDEAHPPIIYESANAPSPTWNVAPDVTHESGVRVIVNDFGDEAAITAQFHHTCSDGVGGLQWIEDLLARYALLTGATSSEVKIAEIDPGRLVDRGRYRVPSYEGKQWWFRGLRELYSFFGEVPKAIAPSVDDVLPPAERSSGMISHRFTADETQRLREAAQTKQAALNDLLICNLFAAVAAWNEERRPGRDDWYRINMPTSLRERDDARTPATNLISYTLLNQRHTTAAGEPDRLLEFVGRESDELRRMPRGTMFLDGLKILSAIPGALGNLLKIPVCMSTAVLTNLGDPYRRFTVRFPRENGLIRAGNLLVKTFGGVPPLRNKTHAAIGVNTYGGRLALNLQMTPELFRPADASRFLTSFVERVRNEILRDTGTRAA